MDLQEQFVACIQLVREILAVIVERVRAAETTQSINNQSARIARGIERFRPYPRPSNIQSRDPRLNVSTQSESFLI